MKQHKKLRKKLKDFQNLVRELVYYRKEMNLTQEELADKIGVANSLISKWENFDRLPSPFMFCCWVDSLGLEIQINKKEITKPPRSSVSV